MATTHYGPWQDIKGYTSVIVTVDVSTSNSNDVDPPCYILWGTGENDNPPRAIGDGVTTDDEIDVLVKERYPIMSTHDTRTVQFDARTRWFRIEGVNMDITNSMHIATQFKVAPTEIQIRDNRTSNIGSGGIVKVNNNAMQIVLTDSSSRLLTNTEDNRNTNYALYTHLADASGYSIDTSASTLAVSIRDASNVAIASLGAITNMTQDDLDVNNFPPSDIVFMVSQAYSMGAEDAHNSNQKRYHLAYELINQFQANLRNKTTYPDIRMSIVTYARPDISCDVGDIDRSVDHTGNIGDTDASIYRTFRPGAIELVSTVNADISTALGFLITAYPSADVCYNYTAVTDASIYHHSHDLSFDYAGGISQYPVMQPGNNIYTVVDKLFSSSSSMGNHVRNPNRSPPTDSSISLVNGKRAVLINISDSSFTDDLQLSSGITNQAIRDGSLGRLISVYTSAQNKLKTLFGENIYSILLHNGTPDQDTKHTHLKLVDPCNSTIASTYSESTYTSKVITASNTHSTGARILPLSVTPSLELMTVSIDLLFNHIFEAEYIGANSVKAVMSDLMSVEQASTDVIEGAIFGGRALYYSLADKNGKQYKTTRNVIDVSTNAMHVHLTDAEGNSIRDTNQLEVYFVDELQQIVTPFDIAVEASLSTTADISNHSFQLRHLGIANELPITIWLKVYDMSTGANTSSTIFTDYEDSLVYNIPVAGNDYRDLHMSDGVQFTKGLHFRISPDYPYDNSYVYLGPDSGRVYVNGACSDLSAN